MAKKAFCVGINDYPYEDSDLNGCVNDARAWADLLLAHFGFTDVRLLLDQAATKANILSGLSELIESAEDGDVLVYTYSGHGTYVADTSGDELWYDEAQCPFDTADNLIVDDELREIIAKVPDGVHLTVISDSCFSGTVTRVPVGEEITGNELADNRRRRFLSPRLRGDKVIDNMDAAKPKSSKFPESAMKEILLTGCNDRQYSYDARIGDTYHGAMTYHAIKAITDAGYDLTYRELHNELIFLVEDAGYPQNPQLEGSDASKDRKLFA